jgi:hypothetical protein
MADTTQQRRSWRQYHVEFSGAMALYVATVLVTTHWLRTHPAAPERVGVALVPVLPVTLALVAILRSFGRADELQRRNLLEALAFAFAGTALFVITYGFLESAGFAPLGAWPVWVVMGALWLVGSLIARWRYR